MSKVFYIKPVINGKATRLKVERILRENFIEHYEVTAKNKSITLETNRLVFMNKGLKHRKGQWKIIAGDLRYSGALEKVIAAIEQVIENKN